MVRLEGFWFDNCIFLAFWFQFLMVRLEALTNVASYTVTQGFNSLWFD